MLKWLIYDIVSVSLLPKLSVPNLWKCITKELIWKVRCTDWFMFLTWFLDIHSWCLSLSLFGIWNFNWVQIQQWKSGCFFFEVMQFIIQLNMVFDFICVSPQKLISKILKLGRRYVSAMVTKATRYKLCPLN